MNERLSNDSIFIHSWKLALLIMVLAAAFRLWGAFELNEYIEDEAAHVPNAISLGTYGTTINWNWPHPQLSGLIISGTIRFFGDNPVGWRSGNIFFGTASVALIFLIGRRLYPGSAVSIIATALLAFDPYHIYLSRTTFMEIPVTFFFLLYLYLLLEYTENRRPTLPLAGIAMGLTIATKAYFVFAIPLAIAYALYRVHQRGELSRQVAVDFTVTLLLLPVAISLLSYFWWFGRGYTFPEFVQMKMDAVWALSTLTLDNFANKTLLEASGKPWEWFIKPIFWGHQRLLNSNEGVFLLHSNNPPFRVLVLPSLFAASVYAWRKKLPQELLAPLLFGCCYLLVLVVRRPMFDISSIVMIPFAYLVLASAVTLIAVKIQRENVVYTCFLSATLIWGMYMFPLVSARMVPLSIFRPILSMVRYMGNF